MKNKKVLIVAIALILVIVGIYMIFRTKKIDIGFKVPNYYSLANYNYNGDFNEFAKDSYNWYKSIEDEEGVYIINT